MNEQPGSGVKVSATEAPRVITPEILPPAVSAGAQTQDVPATGWMRIFWIIVAVLCTGWIFIPNFFFVPIPFFIDEGIAAVILVTALSKIGIRIPFLTWFFQRKFGGAVGTPKK